MERPVSLHPDDIRDEKVKVLRCIPPITLEETVLGQYVAADGKPGYLDDEGVPADSNCPTYATCVLHVNNPRWAGVPFVMKAGKALSERKAEVRSAWGWVAVYGCYVCGWVCIVAMRGGALAVVGARHGNSGSISSRGIGVGLAPADWLSTIGCPLPDALFRHCHCYVH